MASGSRVLGVAVLCFAMLLGSALRADAAFYPLLYWTDGHGDVQPDGTIRHYAVQDVRRVDDTSAEYWGWLGVKGCIYWVKNPVLPVGSRFGLGCISVKTPLGDWLQPGIRMDKDGVPRYYMEHVVGGEIESWPTPWGSPGPGTAQTASVAFAGYENDTPMWEARIDGRYFKRGLRYHSGKPVAQVEISANDGYYGYKAPSVYFGSNSSTYNGTGYALHLLNGSGAWEIWDENITAGRTVAHDTTSQAHMHYSTGQRCYFWLGRDDN